MNLKPRILITSTFFCGLGVAVYLSLFAYFNTVKIAAGQAITENTLLVWLFVFFIWAIIVTGIVFYFLTQTISQPIRWLLLAIKKIAAGDFTA